MSKANKTVFRIALIALILATLAFIFSNSALTREESSEQSGRVAELLKLILPEDTFLGAVIQKYLRKIAHFSEFALLGIFVTLYSISFCEINKKNILLTALFGLLSGSADELLQRFTGRGSMPLDVLIDLSGFIFAMLIVYLIYYIIKTYRREKPQNG